MPIDRHAILATARSYLGVPWAHQGRSRFPGCDCAGLILRVGWDLGMPIADGTAYSRGAPREALDAALLARFVPLSLAAARPGDIVQLMERRVPCHVALLTDKGHPYNLIQTGMHWGHAVEHGYVPPWIAWTVAAWRYPGDILPWKDEVSL